MRYSAADNTANTYLVGSQGDRLRILNLAPIARDGLDYKAAMNLAGYLISMAVVMADHPAGDDPSADALDTMNEIMRR